jgi:hypothetical protein
MDTYTAHLSEQRIENMLLDYWERHSGIWQANEMGQIRFYYWPSCPEVTTEE